MNDEVDNGYTPSVPEEYCHHCGKERYDWSDLGCEYCDARVPGYVGGAQYDVVDPD